MTQSVIGVAAVVAIAMAGCAERPSNPAPGDHADEDRTRFQGDTPRLMRLAAADLGPLTLGIPDPDGAAHVDTPLAIGEINGTKPNGNGCCFEHADLDPAQPFQLWFWPAFPDSESGALFGFTATSDDFTPWMRVVGEVVEGDGTLVVRDNAAGEGEDTATTGDDTFTGAEHHQEIVVVVSSQENIDALAAGEPPVSAGSYVIGGGNLE